MRTPKVRADTEVEDASGLSPQRSIEDKYAGPKFAWWCEPPWLTIWIVGGVTVGRILMALLFEI